MYVEKVFWCSFAELKHFEYWDSVVPVLVFPQERKGRNQTSYCFQRTSSFSEPLLEGSRTENLITVLACNIPCRFKASA